MEGWERERESVCVEATSLLLVWFASVIDFFPAPHFQLDTLMTLVIQSVETVEEIANALYNAPPDARGESCWLFFIIVLLDYGFFPILIFFSFFVYSFRPYHYCLSVSSFQ